MFSKHRLVSIGLLLAILFISLTFMSYVEGLENASIVDIVNKDAPQATASAKDAPQAKTSATASANTNTSHPFGTFPGGRANDRFSASSGAAGAAHADGAHAGGNGLSLGAREDSVGHSRSGTSRPLVA